MPLISDNPISELLIDVAIKDEEHPIMFSMRKQVDSSAKMLQTKNECGLSKTKYADSFYSDRYLMRRKHELRMTSSFNGKLSQLSDIDLHDSESTNPSTAAQLDSINTDDITPHQGRDIDPSSSISDNFPQQFVDINISAPLTGQGNNSLNGMTALSAISERKIYDDREYIMDLEQRLAKANFEAAELRSELDNFKLRYRHLQHELEDLASYCKQLIHVKNKEIGDVDSKAFTKWFTRRFSFTAQRIQNMDLSDKSGQESSCATNSVHDAKQESTTSSTTLIHEVETDACFDHQDLTQKSVHTKEIASQKAMCLWKKDLEGSRLQGGSSSARACDPSSQIDECKRDIIACKSDGKPSLELKESGEKSGFSSHDLEVLTSRDFDDGKSSQHHTSNLTSALQSDPTQAKIMPRRISQIQKHRFIPYRRQSSPGIGQERNELYLLAENLDELDISSSTRQTNDAKVDTCESRKPWWAHIQLIAPFSHTSEKPKSEKDAKNKEKKTVSIQEDKSRQISAGEAAQVHHKGDTPSFFSKIGLAKPRSIPSEARPRKIDNSPIEMKAWTNQDMPDTREFCNDESEGSSNTPDDISGPISDNEYGKDYFYHSS
jgi:hypothetical protein